MTGLLQVGLYTPDRKPIEGDLAEYEKALVGSEYTLDRHETTQNDGIAMIVTKTEWEAARLMEEEPSDPAGLIPLPSGYWMEVPTY